MDNTVHVDVEVVEAVAMVEAFVGGDHDAGILLTQVSAVAGREGSVRVFVRDLVRFGWLRLKFTLIHFDSLRTSHYETRTHLNATGIPMVPSVRS